MPTDPTARRPLKSRDLPIFKNLAALLARAGVSPNAISFFSMVFGAGAGAAFAATPDLDGWALRLAWLGGAVGIQLRLIANLLDGMVAVEGKRGGPTGDLWNEAPDRVADAVIFIGVGYAAGSDPGHGYAAALVAVFVAYTRALGASVGAGQIFIGPMAKPHRMFVLTLLSVAGAIFPHAVSAPFPGTHVTVVLLVLALVIIGGIMTAWRRLSRVAAFLRTKTS